MECGRYLAEVAMSRQGESRTADERGHQRSQRVEYQQRRSVAFVYTPSPDMELGHWVSGSMGHLGHLSRPGHRVAGSSF